jgi:cyclase
MPLHRLIPCLDVRDGRIVKGVQFQNLRDAGDPVEQASLYQDQGADEIVMLDVSATPEGRRASMHTVERLRAALCIPLTVGGGVRTIEDAASLLTAGADKVGVNTAAVKDPALISRLADRFGVQCIVLAVDAKATMPGVWEVVVRSGTQRASLDALAWCQRGASLGAGELLLTSIDRDGTHEGYDLDLIKRVTASVRVPVIASGGASCTHHLVEAIEAGADAVLAASMFHDGDASVSEVKAQMAAMGVPVRLLREEIRR